MPLTKETTKVVITKAIRAMKADKAIMVIEQKTVETTKTTETNKVPVYTTAILLLLVSIARLVIDIWFDISIF